MDYGNILVSRQGLEKQKYDGKIRLVAGCVPYRVENGVAEVMLTLCSDKSWIFPKGLPPCRLFAKLMFEKLFLTVAKVVSHCCMVLTVSGMRH